MEYIKFGEYPQTIKADDVTLTDVRDERGYYIGSDGCRYAAVTATPHESGFRFSTGAPIVKGETYYFKVEPICWGVLAKRKGTAFLLCEHAIASHRFAEKSNNYARSEIREWLNSAFLDTAFSAEEQGRILLTKVDNSVASTGYKKNEYACEDTEDQIFLMSHADSRATGAYIDTNGERYGNGYWWLRSPGDAQSYARVRVVFSNGVSDYSYYYPNGDYGSVVPALWIKL